ncbi:hypothetical protein GXW82_09585 [Streptacidiphilus sp. 4-A2]|nr:hypothetical protein [Streptacidiphilus sp. 4-A2]
MSRIAPHRLPRRGLLFLVIAALGFAALAAGLATQSGGSSAAPQSSGSSTPGELAPLPGSVASSGNALPLFAYYYIWFSPDSWRRAKLDYPLLGDYSSSNPAVVKQQIEWAKAAGIQGFIVSWKDTALNDSRLQLVMRIAAQENFKLAMIYQGLDFTRKPLPEAEVAKDFRTFETTYAPNPVFYKVGGKALTIWSGTWEYSAADVQAVTSPLRGKLLVLNTQKSVASYNQIAAYTDGDAYYWSSVDPQTDKGYPEKLQQMAATVHAHGGYWIAPFAPGFDAKLVGGTGTVPRDNAQVLRTEYTAAVGSSPDMLGLISWNEFSENSYIEPSKEYGYSYLDAVAQLRGATVPAGLQDIDSSAQSGTQDSAWPDALLLGGCVLICAGAAGFAAAARAARRRPGPPRAGGWQE